ncbi:MAG: hypothetical protein AB1Z98_40200 [Nannocystaceae bacterium]
MSSTNSATATAIRPRDETSLVQVPEDHLRPTTRGQELMVSMSLYFAVVIPAMLFGSFTGMFAVGLFLMGWVFHRRRTWFRTNTRLRAIREALASDDLGHAARICQLLLADVPKRSLAHTIAVGNWGVIELRRGRPREAITLLERVLATGRFKGRIGTLLEIGNTTGTLALAHAIVGEVELSRRILAQAREQFGPGREGMLFMFESYLLAREGRWSELVGHFDSQWRAAEPKLGIGTARTARLLEAMALEHVGGDEYRSGVGDRQQRALERAREAPRGAFDYLMVEWDEGQDFLRRHQLS